jgi:hypothetical protein
VAEDIADELTANGSDLSLRAARYIRIKRETERGLREQLRRCHASMECNDPIAARDIFGTPTIHGAQPATETLPIATGTDITKSSVAPSVEVGADPKCTCAGKANWCAHCMTKPISERTDYFGKP